MKVYVITEGNWDDYHICTACTDEAVAHQLADEFKKRGGRSVEVEEFDTDEHLPCLLGMKIYTVMFDGRIERATVIKEANPVFFKPGISGYGNKQHYAVNVYAYDETEAEQESINMLRRYLHETLDR